jgi:hypothetical protein
MIPSELEAVACLGWAVFPASQYSRKSCFSGAHDAATSDLDTIAMWCRDYAGCNWRVAFGLSNLWGLDVDAPGPNHAADGLSAMRDLIVHHGPLPDCPATRSGGGGYAIFFRHEGEPIAGKTGHPAPGIDPRRGRQSVTIPPSVHTTTRRPYVWTRPPWETSPPHAPKWLLDAVRPPPEVSSSPLRIFEGGERARNYAVAALRQAIGRVATAASGSANDTLNREAYAMARFLQDGLVSAQEIRDCLLAAARARSIPIREAVATIESGIRSRART